MRGFSFIVLLMTCSLFSCSSQKKLDANPPIALGEASCQEWKGGRAETGSGMLLTIPVLDETVGNIQMKQAFFRGKVADITMESSDNGWLLKANFLNQKDVKPDIIMDADPKKEVGNQPPIPTEEFPFELEPDQCVLSYLKGEKVNYFMVTEIREKKLLIYQ